MTIEAATLGPTAKGQSLGRDALKRFFRHPTGMVGLFIVSFFVLASLLAPVLKPYDASRDRDLRARLAPPSAERWFGADELGRDQFTRVWHGGRISLRVGLAAVTVAVVVGTLLGVLAGFFGGWLDTAVVWTMDILLAFPGVLLAIVIVATLGPNLTNALIAISITQVPIYTRIMRSVVMSVREAEFVHGARSLGARSFRIVMRHVLPNSLSPLIVQLTLSIGTAILDVAALGFLGLGAQPPQPEWGLMIRDGFTQFVRAPWMSAFPGIAIFFSVVGFNLLGDAVRDVLDPRLRNV
ncbi:MAG: ABC transporter permease [Trueperaceae bacterium]|nr:ABC transporter permease [Trueperaceae bacterium]